MTKLDTAYCFIDTDVLIHFQTFDEVDWLSAINAKTVCLVLASTVMAEINELKDRATDWRGKRARKVVSMLRAKLKEADPGQPVEIRPGVSLMDIAGEPVVDWREQRLDPNINDDRLLATILGFAAEHPSSEIFFLSNDFNAWRKARRCGIAVIDPEEKQVRRFERPSDEEAKIRRLEQRVYELENRIPKLELNFWENGSTTNTIIRTIEGLETQVPSLEEIEQTLDKKKERLEGIHQQAKMMGRLESDTEEFASEYYKYIEELGPALKLKRTRDAEHSCFLEFVLSNAGSALANAVEASLQFPSNSFVVGASDTDSPRGEVWIPDEPGPRWAIASSRLFGRDYLIQPLTSNQPPEHPGPTGPIYCEDLYKRSIVWYETPKLRSMDSWHMEPVIAYLPPEIRHGFQIQYSIHADELPNWIEGHLNVRLQKR
jgi:hypothetical protein